MADADARVAEPLLTTQQVAQRLGVSAETVRRLAKRGTLPVVRPYGLRAVRYRREDLARLLAGEKPE